MTFLAGNKSAVRLLEITSHLWSAKINFINCYSWLLRGYWLTMQGLYISDLVFSFEIKDRVEIDTTEYIIYFWMEAKTEHLYLGQEIFIFWWKNTNGGRWRNWHFTSTSIKIRKKCNYQKYKIKSGTWIKRKTISLLSQTGKMGEYPRDWWG